MSMWTPVNRPPAARILIVARLTSRQYAPAVPSSREPRPTADPSAPRVQSAPPIGRASTKSALIQLWMSFEPGLYQSKVSRSLSRAVWSKCHLPRRLPHSNVYLRRWPDRRSLHPMPAHCTGCRDHQSLPAIALWRQCRMHPTEWSWSLSVSLGLLWKPLRGMSPGVCSELGLSLEQSLSAAEVPWSLPRKLRTECRVQCGEPHVVVLNMVVVLDVVTNLKRCFVLYF